ncbi:hypothetical protein ACI0FN_03181 [Alcaligenes nematophilus]|uniref:zinc-ribbon and DUF3426 domain-containing protein n=1 Tax=Alcaligenes nematophilus TaxID=2994643 RepID=UPI003851110C
MELKTRCPRCGTSFAASVETLQRRRGYIRCIQCAHIFDGFEEVIDEQAPEPSYHSPATPVQIEPRLAPEPPVSPRQEQVQSVDLQAPIPGPRFVEHSRHAPPRDEGTAHESLQVRKFPDSILTQAPVTPAAPAAVATEPFVRPAEPAVESVEPSVIRARSRHEPLPQDDQDTSFFVSTGAVSEPDGDHHIGQASWSAAEPEFSVGDRASALRASFPSRQADGTHDRDGEDFQQDWVIAPNPALQRETRYEGEASFGQRVGSLIWTSLCVLGVVLFVVQLMYVYRVQIVSQIPMLRPVFESACQTLSCKVPYERRLDQIRVQASALHKAPNQPGQSTLGFTLRNEFERPQEWPTLVLDLKDFSGALIARRNITPDQYLASERREPAFAARSEIMVRLPLNTGQLQVNGYQISPFFP